MTAEAAIFTCSICGEPAGEICVYCTKDACANHRCDRCKRCSDCCECDIPLSAAAPTVLEEEAPTTVLEEVETQTHSPVQLEVPPPEPQPQPDNSLAPEHNSEHNSEHNPEPTPPQTENPIF